MNAQIMFLTDEIVLISDGIYGSFKGTDSYCFIHFSKYRLNVFWGFFYGGGGAHLTEHYLQFH